MNIDKYRPIPFYFITTHNPDELTYEKAYESLSHLKEKGFGGIILFNKPPHGFNKENYLSKEWFDMVKNFILAAKELALRVWINDGFDYPPGGVAGKIYEADKTLSQQRFKLVDGKLVFEKVEWGYPAFEYKRSSDLFIELVYERYKKEVGEYFGNVIEGFFSDADNRRVNARVYNENSCENDFFPWCDGFKESFEEVYSYDITPHLEKIAAREACKEARDYWEHTSYLYQQWFAGNYKWLKANGLKYSFHTSDTSPMTIERSKRSSVFMEGRALDIQSNCDFPGTDQELLEIDANKIFIKEHIYEPEVSWGDNDKLIRNDRYYELYEDVRSKQSSSTAFLYDKETALCEMFAASNWGATYSDLRDIACWQVMQGIGFIVPHAYHHRLLGKTKYFAPPDFSAESHLDTEMKEFNDTISKYAAICNEGKLVAPVALLDISEELWYGKNIGEEFFEAADKLNRLPYGYVIADMKGIKRKQAEFKVVINPGVELNKEDEEYLNSNFTVITVKELDKLSEIIPVDVKFEGTGTPHYMRRMTDKGEMLIIANVQNKEPVCGKLTYKGKTYEIELYCGELAYFTESDACFRKPYALKDKEKITLDSTAEVVWADENIIPIERWMDKDYKPILKTDEGSELMFTYTVKSDIGNLKLYISKAHCELISKVMADGVEKKAVAFEKVFDDEYAVFDISSANGLGKHALIIEKNGILNEYDRIFIKGEFDVLVNIYEKFHKKSAYQYNMFRYIPRAADVILSTPEKKLSLEKSWAEQGRPFYSGTAVYKMNFKADSDIEKALLNIPKAAHALRVSIDGKDLGARLWAPYAYEISLSKGEHQIEIKSTNTLANAMEFYKASSGIEAVPEIYVL